MTQRKLIWQIFPANLVILILTVICIAWFTRSSLETFYLEELEDGLVARAYLIRLPVATMLKREAIGELRDYSKISGRESNTRITVIMADGKVVADSNENPATMEPHHNRVEIRQALGGEIGSSLRYSKTLGKKMLYVAIPVYDESQKDAAFTVIPEVTAVLRMAVTVDAIEVAMQRIYSRVLFGLAALALLAAFASLLVSRNISRPLEEMKKAAERFSRGDFSGRMSTFKGASASLEVSTLASAMDRMAAQLGERIETIRSQRNELETVFSSMVESVIAVDSSERILNLNSAAARLLGIEREAAKGKIIQEVLRNIDLQEQIKQVTRTGTSMEDEIIHMDDEGQKFLQTNIVSLSDQHNTMHGVLVVLNDVTKLRRLESMRRDFVANVSHELRTPITSIRGYVETLLDGALENREDALRFLETVLRQAERLNEIIDDLMALSRIEQEADHGHIKLETGSLCMVLDVAIETCEHRAEDEGVAITLDCPDPLQLPMNTTLIEQALVNLLVNAIQYSKDGDTVSVTVKTATENGVDVVRISVADTGVGIASNHLPRLFERFYRSDKARSRTQGGTGLGLAIVKHIVLAHNGRVEVTSKLNAGSTFIIILPLTR